MMRFLFLAMALLTTASVQGQTDLDFVWSNAVTNAFPNSTTTVAVDSAGEVLTGGYFGGTLDFDPGPGVVEFTAGNQNEPYIARYNGNGSLLWALHFVGRGQVADLALDSQGNIFITGYFLQNLVIDTNTTLGPVTGFVQFVLKLDPAGNFVWGFALEGTVISGISMTLIIDGNDDIILGGTIFATADLDPGAGVAEFSAGPNRSDSFIAKYDNDGAYLWGQIIRQNSSSGAVSSDTLNDLRVDASDNIYAAGVYNGSTTFGRSGNSQTLISSSTDAFLLKTDSAGDLLWVRSTSGTGLRKENFSLGMDALGNLYMTGLVLGEVDFDPGPVAEALADTTFLNGYLLSYTPSGDFRWFGLFNSPSITEPREIHVAADGTLTVVGGFSGVTDFNPGPGTLEFTAQSRTDSFFARYDNGGQLIDAYHLEGSPNFSQPGAFINSLARAGTGFIMVGEFRLTVDFDPGEGNVSMIAPFGSQDGFVARYGGAIFADGFEGTEPEFVRF